MEKKEHRLAVIMFTDIQDFSRMLELNETETLKILEFHNQTIRELVTEYHGQVIKTGGDAFLSSFTSTLDAVKCAITIQERTFAYNETRTKLKDTDLNLHMRIGIHLGDIYFYDNDALGEGINIASRLQALTKPGRICLSGDVFNQVYNKLNVKIENLGLMELKNISRKIEVYEIILRDENMSGKEISGKTDDNRIDAYIKDNPQNQSSPVTPVDFDETREFIVEFIKKAGRRLPAEKIKKNLGGFFTKLDHILDQLVEKGYLTRFDKADGSINYGVNAPGKINAAANNWDEKWDKYYDKRQYSHNMRKKYEDYYKKKYTEKDWEYLHITEENYKKHLQHTIEEAGRVKAGLAGHLTSYIIVNAFILFLNLNSHTQHPFFLYPLLGWGIGIISHISNVLQQGKDKKELERVQDNITGEQYTLVRKYQNKRRGFFNHLASNLTITALLLMIYFLNPVNFPWPLIPIGGMAIGVVSHLASYLVNKSSIGKKLRQRVPQFFKKGKATQIAPPYPAAGNMGVVEKAVDIKNSILNQLKGFKKGESPFGEDIKPVLDNYIEQIKLLNQKNDELARFMQSLTSSHTELEKDLALLKKKYEQSNSENLKLEYKKSIIEIEKQHKSITDLKNQKEILSLRLNSSLNTLNQIQIDLARMKGVAETGEQASVNMIKDKTKELSQYIEDLKTGYAELEE